MKLSALLKKEIEDHLHDERLLDIYIGENKLDKQRQRYINAIEQFENLYGVKEIEIYSAPGRSEIGGNHTDHQHGKVLAASINLDCIAIVAKREESIIKIVSDDFDIAPIDLNDLTVKEAENGTSEALIRGVCHQLTALGYQIGGFDAYMTSEVLMGAGLSSSAAFEVAVGSILSGLYNGMTIDPVEIAKVGQYAENVYFKKPCGLMDQMASSVGSIISIDFKNIDHPQIQRLEVDFPAFKHSLCIVDTKGSHADLTDDYAAIPVEMKEVAQVFGQQFLCDISEADFYANLNKVHAACHDRALLRAIHLFEENKRVEKEVDALNARDFEAFKKQVQLSGNSSFKYLQNVYSNHDIQNQSIPLGLALTENFLQDAGVCRVHGGGFAGTIQAFVPDHLVEAYQTYIESFFGEGTCHILKIRKQGGIKVM